MSTTAPVTPIRAARFGPTIPVTLTVSYPTGEIDAISYPGAVEARRGLLRIMDSLNGKLPEERKYRLEGNGQSGQLVNDAGTHGFGYTIEPKTDAL